MLRGGDNGRWESALAISAPNTQQRPVSDVSKQDGSSETEGSNNSNIAKLVEPRPFCEDLALTQSQAASLSLASRLRLSLSFSDDRFWV